MLKLVICKWRNGNGEELISMDLVYQKTEQLRDMTILDMDNPPGIFNIRLNGLKEAGNGMYKAEEVMERITEAEDRYDSIIERYELHKAA